MIEYGELGAITEFNKVIIHEGAANLLVPSVA
jgi:hypothetical protein